MGRQAHLAKIAFGRSAFEPSQEAFQSSEYIQLESRQAELPQRYLEATPNNYIQLYDERGNPINPRSREHGKKLRKAQNDVLASVGVVHRRRAPSQSLPGSFEEQVRAAEREDFAGNALAIAATLIESSCTWWIGAIRDRILTFRFHDVLSLTQLVAAEWASSGKSILFTGSTSRLLHTWGTNTCSIAIVVFQSSGRILAKNRAPPWINFLIRSGSRFMSFGFVLTRFSRPVLIRRRAHMFPVILFFPFAYHANLQLLGLIPASPLLPDWRALIPFSTSSPLSPMSPFYSLSTSPVEVLKALLTSPLALVYVEQLCKHWAHTLIRDAVGSSVIRPVSGGVHSSESSITEHDWTAPRSCQRTSPRIRGAINNILVLLGWADPSESQTTCLPAPEEDLQGVSSHEQTIDIGGTTVVDIAPLDLPVVRATQGNHISSVGPSDAEVSSDSPDQPATALAPFIPSALSVHQPDEDSSIRIASAEGVAEMGVRPPSQVLLSHTEVIDSVAASRIQRDATAQTEARSCRASRRHHVSQLSILPAHRIGAIFQGQIVGLAMLPLRIAVLRLIAAHHLQGAQFPVTPALLNRTLIRWDHLSWRVLGIQASRVALCGVLELATDFALWGVQCAAAVGIGKKFFGWGTF